MSNPIFNSMQTPHSNNANFNSNNLINMMQQIKNSSNPQQAMQNLIQSNPNFQNIVNYINQNGGDAKTAFYNMAAQKGVDPNSILSQLR